MQQLSLLRHGIVAILLAGLLVGCGAESPPESSMSEPAPASAAEETNVPATTDSSWPREVTDATGETIVLASKPGRVITLSLGLDEIVMALAGPERFAAISDIARSENSNVADLAKQVPTTVTADLERILGLSPDLLLLDGFAQPDLVAQARSAGLPVVVTDLHHSFDQHLENIDFLAYVLGEEARAARLRTELEQRAQELAQWVEQARQGNPAPKVLHLTPSLHIPGSETTSHDMIERAGGVNLAAENGLQGWQQVTLEKVVEWAPEVIFFDEYDVGNLHAEILRHPSMQDVPAVVDGRLYEIPMRYITSLSFWNLRGAEELARRLWPEVIGPVRFEDFDFDFE